MWGTVLVLALAAGLGPQRIAAVAVLLSWLRPVRLLFAYFVGGFGVTLVVGSVILFALQEEAVSQSSALPSEIEIVVGVLGLIAAALAGSGMVSPLQVRWRSRVPRLVHTAVESDSVWIAWGTGVVVGLPFLYLLAAVAAVLEAGVATSTQVVSLVVFGLVARWTSCPRG
jgi:Sap, sulfolipid-1-addressing protein